MDWLQKVHNIQPQAWPYTYVKSNDQGEIIWGTDLWARYNPEKAVVLSGTYTSSKGVDGTLYRSLSGYVEKDNLQIYTDDWGSWISAYQPVKNSKGEIVGAIGVDFEASYVKQVQQSILNVMWLAGGVTGLILFVLVFGLSGLFTQPIVALTHAAERIGEGDYEQDLSKYSGVGGLTRDEIGTLAEVFTIMVNKVYQREQALRRQVEELKIEVDEAKRQKQVSEIVDTGFFQELQDKAREMRSRRRGGGTPPQA
jgi:methyl-accepting chemotaxis protein